MFQTWDNSQLLRRVLWISAELTIVSSLKHKNTQLLYIFNRVRVLHLDRLKEGTWLHSFGIIKLNNNYQMMYQFFSFISTHFDNWQLRILDSIFSLNFALIRKKACNYVEQCQIGEICFGSSDPQLSKKTWKTTFWPKYKSGYLKTSANEILVF